MAFMALFTNVLFAQTTYKVDDQKASIRFQFVEEKVEGSFTGFEAKIIFDEQNPTSSSIIGSVNAASINTGVTKRDQHLRSADYFHVDKYPKIKFESTRIQKGDNGYTMSGNITIKDITKPITWNFTFDGDTFKAKGMVKSKDFGLKNSDVKILLSIPVTK